METETEHKLSVGQFIEAVARTKNSKILTKDKYDRIVAHKSGGADSDPKFRWWVKEKKYELVSYPEINVIDVLCVPAKKVNENDPTILGKWRIQTHADNIYDILRRIHWSETNHVGYKKMLAQVQAKYDGMPRSVVQEFCRTCPVCQLSVRQTNHAELKPIVSSGFLTRVQIDLIDMRHKPDGDYNYIAHLMDHWSKFHVIWPIKRKTADEVATGLHERVFPYIGLPRILHSDNGREFVNKVIHSVVKDWGGEDDVLFINGRPRHSQSQGLVEQGNATIERHIANKRASLGLESDNSYPWARWLPKIQYNMNTEVAEGTKKMPYEIVFGQPPRTTIFPDAKVEGRIVNEEELDIENTESTNILTSTEETIHTEEPHPAPTNEPIATSSRTDDAMATPVVTCTTNDPVPRPIPAPRLINMPCILKSTRTTNIDPSNTQATTGDIVISESHINPTDELHVPMTPPTPAPRRKNHPNESEIILLSELAAIHNISTDEKNTNNTDILSTPPANTSVQTAKSTLSKSVPSSASNITHSENNMSNIKEPITEHIDTKPGITQSETQEHGYNKHDKVRKEADITYRQNAEKMKAKYAKKKRVDMITFTEGQAVTIKIPKIDRSATDHPRLVCKVKTIKGDSEKRYQLVSEHGIIDTWVRSGDIMPYQSAIDNISFPESKSISIREASRLTNSANGIRKKKCNCKSKCAKNCSCVKQNITCSSHCHPTLVCSNKENIIHSSEGANSTVNTSTIKVHEQSSRTKEPVDNVPGHPIINNFYKRPTAIVTSNVAASKVHENSTRPQRQVGNAAGRSITNNSYKRPTTRSPSNATATATNTRAKSSRKELPIIKGDWLPELLLTQEERSVVTAGRKLNDKHINAAQTLLKKQFPETNGLRDTFQQERRNPPKLVPPYLQIYHVNADHWITVQGYDSPNAIEVYDSLNTDRSSTIPVVAKSHPHHAVKKIMNMQRQEGTKDCGLFAIASVTSLCNGEDPTSQIFNQQQMREHFISNLESGRMTIFPHTEQRCKRRVKFNV